MSRSRVVVVGGGIAGMATALRLEEALTGRGLPHAVTVLEAGPRVGGNIRTETTDGYTLEWGPNGFLDNVPATLELARDLGLEGELQPADARSSVRYVWRQGRLHPVPTGPGPFVSSPLLSLRGRARVLMEPFQPKGPVDADESVRRFATRRIGREAADVLVDAMVSGVFAGDAAALSLPAAFPKMRAMEAEHGSLVRAMIARRREGGGGGPAGPGGTLTSFREGMATLTHALARRLVGRIRLGTPVRALRREGGARRWVVTTGAGEELTADHVVVAVPAPAAARIAATVSPELGAVLREMPTAGLAVVALGYPEAALSAAPDGFGFLVPRAEGLRMLGCLRDSTIFPGRAPDGCVLLRVMIGGAHDPDAVQLGEEELSAIVRRELAVTMGVRAEPELVRVFRHPLGIGQYTLGHLERVARARGLLAALPGLSVTGSSYEGVSMNACVEHAAAEAESVVSRLADRAQESRRPLEEVTA